MIHLLIRIGTWMTLMALLGFPQHMSAMESASFRLTTDFPSYAEHRGGTSTNYQLEGGVTWNQKPLTGTTAQIVTEPGAASSTGGGASSQASSQDDGDDQGGGRRSRTSQASISSQGSTVSQPASSRGVVRSRSRGRSSVPAGHPSAPLPGQLPTGEFLPSLHFLEQFGLACPSCPACPGISSAAPACDPGHGAAHAPGQGGLFNWLLLLLAILLAFLAGVLAALRRTTGWLQGYALAHLIPSFLHTREEQKKEGGKRTSRVQRTKRAGTSFLQSWLWFMLLVLALLIASLVIAPAAHAANTGPLTHTYNGHLLDSSGNPLTSAHSIRFSYWKSADYVAGDVDGSGNINTSATNYASWNEVHSVTPNADGYFSVEMGSVTALPNFATMQPATLSGLYLQVEVKLASNPNTSYELLDSNPNSSTVDRSHVNSVPFALNANLLDQRDTGTGSGSIPVLQSGGLLPVSTIPGGTNRDTFVIDADSSATTIALTFGQSLSRTLSYDVANTRFNFNDDLRVQGDLTVTGLINGIDLSNLQSSTGALKVSSGGGLNINVAQGGYRLNGDITNYSGASALAMQNNTTNYVFFGSGGYKAQTTSFPTDESYIPLAKVITANGSIQNVVDRRVLQSDDREETVLISHNAEYPNASYQGDGADNVGQLSLSHDNITLRNFYIWTSTRATAQDYDILVRATLSPDFARWKTDGTDNPITIQYRTTSAATSDNKLDIQIYDTSGVPITLSGSVTNLASTSWASTGIEFTGSPTWTAGQEFLIRLKLSSKGSYQVHVGSMQLKFVDFHR